MISIQTVVLFYVSYNIKGAWVKKTEVTRSYSMSDRPYSKSNLNVFTGDKTFHWGMKKVTLLLNS